jgi:fatty-acyl-CoA synthase
VSEKLLKTYLDKGVLIRQLYGQTEAGGQVTINTRDGAVKYPEKCGRGGPFTKIAIKDNSGNFCPPNTPGEIIIKGPTVMAGYWNDPEATAEVIRDGWFHSGDVAVVDEEGYVTIVDRLKDMFVSGGENVYPPRVEDALTDHPGIEEAVVIGVPSERWGTVGKAIVVGDESLTLDDVEGHLAPRVARYAVPKELAFVDEMPTSGPSKIDRTALKDRFGE